MKNILVIGAGRSGSVLIEYLLKHAASEDWMVHVGDIDEELASRKTGGHPRSRAFRFNALDLEERRKEVARADLIISMLPANMHHHVAMDAVIYGKNVITPSYVSPEMAAFDSDISEKGILFLTELGVDPGIDHMTAMEIAHRIDRDGGEIIEFESFTGGLIAPESDNNPWGYKFTWNPKNVVLAGQGGAARYVQQGEIKYIPYHQLFRRYIPVSIEGVGEFEGYANRDSLRYREVYGMENIRTLQRGTLRRKGFCDAWNVFVQLGCTDDSYIIENSAELTLRRYLNMFMAFDPRKSVEDKLRSYLNLSDEIMDKLAWLGFFSGEPVGIHDATPARVLQHVLEKKWALGENDLDRVVMWHRFIYREASGKVREVQAYLDCLGEDTVRTAMARTVGLPLAIAARKVLNREIRSNGVQLPVSPEIYRPILAELAEEGIKMVEQEIPQTP